MTSKKKKEDRYCPVLSGILFLRKREFQWCKTLEWKIIFMGRLPRKNCPL